MNWNTADFQPAPCFPCFPSAVGDLYLTVPIFFIDGTNDGFPNSTAAQNFFDNSGALWGCRASFPGSPACNCIVEAQTNFAGHVTGSGFVDTIGADYLLIVSQISSSDNVGGTFGYVCAINVTTAPALVTINGSFGSTDYFGGGANVSLYDASQAFVTSNVVGNANINTLSGWSAWQNLSIPTAGKYFLVMTPNISPGPNSITGQQLSWNPNITANVAFDLFTTRANYGTGYIYCTS